MLDKDSALVPSLNRVPSLNSVHESCDSLKTNRHVNDECVALARKVKVFHQQVNNLKGKSMYNGQKLHIPTYSCIQRDLARATCSEDVCTIFYPTDNEAVSNKEYLPYLHKLGLGEGDVLDPENGTKVDASSLTKGVVTDVVHYCKQTGSPFSKITQFHACIETLFQVPLDGISDKSLWIKAQRCYSDWQKVKRKTRSR